MMCERSLAHRVRKSGKCQTQTTGNANGLIKQVRRERSPTVQWWWLGLGRALTRSAQLYDSRQPFYLNVLSYYTPERFMAFFFYLFEDAAESSITSFLIVARKSCKLHLSVKLLHWVDQFRNNQVKLFKHVFHLMLPQDIYLQCSHNSLDSGLYVSTFSFSNVPRFQGFDPVDRSAALLCVFYPLDSSTLWRIVVWHAYNMSRL